MKRIFSIHHIAWVAFGVLLLTVGACNKDNPEDAPDRVSVTTFDDLDYFQNSIVRVDSMGNFLYRIYGEFLDLDDTTHLYIGVEDLAEARALFDSWIAPDASVSESDGNVTCQLTDKKGKAQGTVYFRPTGVSQSVAEVSVSEGTGVRHFSQISFLLNSAWPLTSATSIWHKFDIVRNVRAANIQEYLHPEDQSLNWVCVRESGNGQKAVFCAVTRTDYDCGDADYYNTFEEWESFTRVKNSRFTPAVGSAMAIGNIMQADWDLFWNVFQEAGCGDVGRMCWYCGSHWAWFRTYHELIFYKDNYTYGEFDANNPFLLKIDWLEDEQMYDGASVGY